MAVAGAFWCGWGFVGCGLLPAWRQGWRGLQLLPASVLASFAMLFSSALVLQLAAVPLTRLAWIGVLTSFALAAALLPGRPPVEPEPPPAAGPGDGPAAYLLAIAAGIALFTIVYRAEVQPLTGPDTIFRWDFLARQILGSHGMGFYPPVSDADFGRYMWPDGIPPLLSLLYAWSYMGFGSAAATGTGPVVIFVAFLGYVLVGMLAWRLAGRRAAVWAVAVLAGSALFTWSISMGQETGLTTLGTLALAWAVGNCESELDWRLAGLAAGVAALSRDYGLGVPVVGFVYMVWRRRPVRELVGFGALVAAIAAPWYARNWVRTGNPFYNLDVLGLYPTNETHAGLMRSYVRTMGFGGNMSERLHELAPLLWPLGCGLLLASLAAVRVREAWPVSLRWLSALWLALWLWSVGYTAGGLGYSLRVLDPLLAMLACAGGVALSKAPRAWSLALAVILLAFAGEASLRALLMMRMPLGIPPESWTSVGRGFSAKRGDASDDRVAAIVGSHAVFVDDAYAHALLAARGVAVVPPWAPELGFLRDPNIDMPAAIRRLHGLGIDYMWLTAARETRSYFGGFKFFDELDPWVRPEMNGDNWVLFSLVYPPGEAPGAPAAPPRSVPGH
jgi:hypothetical protein